MAQAKGAKARLLIDYETTYGQDPGTPAAFVLPVNSIGLTGSQVKNSPATITGTRNPVKPFAGNVDAGGPLVIPVDYTAMWYWLKAMFGVPTTTGTGPWDHEYKIGDTQPSLVLEKQFQDITYYWKYNGCKIASMTLSLGGDGELVMNLNIIAAKENSPSGTPYDSSPTSVSLGRLSNFQASVKEGGSVSSEIVTLDLTVDFGLDPDQRMIGGAGQRADIPEGILSITGNITAIYQDNSLITKGVNNTESSLEIIITSGTNVLDILIAELEYERFQTPVEGPQGVRQTSRFFGFYDNDAEASAILVTLTNSDEHA